VARLAQNCCWGPLPPEAAAAQQGWPAPPQATQLPLWQIPVATQPFCGQQGIPTAPHPAWQVPATQFLPAAQLPSAQQD
jgi:hypothetical protein